MLRVSLLFIFVLSCFAQDDYFDHNASSVTEYDLKLMEEFDTLVYNISDVELKTLDVNAIYNFIKIHKAHKYFLTSPKVELRASIGQYNYHYNQTSDKDNENFNNQSISVHLNYPLYNPDQEQEIHNLKVQYNFKILDDLDQYSKLRDRLIAVQRDLRFTRLIQIKDKLQVKKGIRYLDNKIKTVAKILQLQNEILDYKSKLKMQELVLLNYVQPSFKEGLRRLLHQKK